MTPTTVMSAYAASKVPSLGRIVPLLLVLTMLIASTSGFYLTPPQIMPTDASLKAEPTVNSASEATLYDYSLYLASPNGTAGGDGYMTTQVPVSGCQDEEYTADKDVYFNSPEMLEDLSINGRPQPGSANGFYLPATLFIKSTGPDGASAHWRIFLLDENTVVAQDDWETTVCTPTFLSSCSYAERNFQLKWSGTGNAADIINVSSGDQLRLQVRADIDCQSDPPDPNPDGGDAGTGTEGRQTTPNSDCTASIAFNEIDDASNRFSFIDIEANALKQSIITVQRSGSGAGDTEPVTEWFPNDVLSERAMQFRFHVTSSFGRFDINNVRLTVKSPSGDYVLDDQIDASWKDVDDTPWGLFGTGLWTYPGGLESGEYVVKIVVDDIQGNSISIDHPNLQMRRYGVALRHGEGRNVEYIAPSQQTSIPLQLHHRGSISEELEVELKLLTNIFYQ